MTEIDSVSTCELCDDFIKWNGIYWDHVGTSPRHIGVPQEITRAKSREHRALEFAAKELFSWIPFHPPKPDEDLWVNQKVAFWIEQAIEDEL